MRHYLCALSVLASSLVVFTADASVSSIQTIATFEPAASELPESVTMNRHGTIYLSMGATVRCLAPGQPLRFLAAPPLPAGATMGGLKVSEDGDVYAVSAAFFPSPSAAFVWRIESNGTVHQVAALDPEGFPEDLVFDNDGNLFVTDSFKGTIWKVDRAGEANVWLENPLLLGRPEAPAFVLHEFGGTGLAFDRAARHLYVANLDEGTILRIAIRRDGSPGDVEVFADDPLLVGADGIAFDMKGSLYVAVNTQDRLVRVDKHGWVSVVADGGALDGPSSIVFGTRSKDKHSLYVANFAINRALGTQPGTPRPSVLSIDLSHRGIALP